MSQLFIYEILFAKTFVLQTSFAKLSGKFNKITISE